MQRLFNVRQPAFYFGNDTHEIINIEPAARRARHDGYSARAQAERLHYFPGHANFFLRFGSERNANCVANSFVQKNTEADRRLDRAGKRSPGFGHAQMKWIIDFFSEQPIGSDGPLHIRSLQ